MTQSTNNEASNFLAAIFDGCEADDDFEIAVSWSDQNLAGKDGWLSAGCETTEAPAVLANQHAATADVYVGLGRRYPGTTTRYGRGRREDVADLPCLWADIDWKDDAHKADDGRLPTPEQARALVDTFPLDLGVVVASGGGLHAYCLLTEALDPSKPEHLDLLLRWKGWWLRSAQRAGFSIDAGVLADTTRVLRIPGTWRHKTQPPLPVVLERCEESVRWSLDDLDAVSCVTVSYMVFPLVRGYFALTQKNLSPVSAVSGGGLARSELVWRRRYAKETPPSDGMVGSPAVRTHRRPPPRSVTASGSP